VSRPRIALAIVVGLVVLVGAVGAGRSVISSPSTGNDGAPAAPPKPRAAAPRPVTGTPAGFVRYRNVQAGFSIAYPRAWARKAARDPEVKLLATSGGAASVLVRSAHVGLDVTPQTLPIVRDLTDNLVQASRGVKQLTKPAPIELGGLPGYLYLYTFASGPNRPRGAHVHYFLFKGGRLITIVLQVEPAKRLQTSAPVFKQIAETFRGNV